MIGIVTVYTVPNYGTKLQAYAMQNIMSKYDKAELIGFVSKTDTRPSAVFGKLYLKVHRKRNIHVTRPDIEQTKIREKAIASFDKYYNFGKTIKGTTNLRKEAHKYRAIVCGSDQLWAPINVIADYYTLTAFPKDMIRFSYAASFGVSEIPTKLKKKYTVFLKRLSKISVREESGAQIVQELTGYNAQVVLDPTLMVERREWEALCKTKKESGSGNYIFCYFLGKQMKHREFVNELAKLTGKQIITIPHFKEWNEADQNFGDIQLYNVDPVDFLNYIKNADIVCTDSFHGTVFSLIFNCKVAVFERFNKASRESTNSRIYSLLKQLNLESQLITEETSVEGFLQNEIPYNTVEKRLQSLRADSFAYLDAVLGRGQQK